MDDLFFIPEVAEICVKVQYVQSAKFPADDHSVCSITSWFEVYLQRRRMEAQIWERLGSAGNSISLNYWFTAGKASRAASWLLRYHKTAQQPPKYFGALRKANWYCQKTISCFPYARPKQTDRIQSDCFIVPIIRVLGRHVMCDVGGNIWKSA